MLYLKASEQIQFLDEYEGQKGKYIKTFALNDKRNKNGWRVTWASIKKNIHTFLDDGGRPGIEYVKCEGTVCDLDHTEGATFEQSLQVQEPFRVTTLIDFDLDEATHTAFFIHKLNDDASDPNMREAALDFYERVKNGKIKFVSPAIWPQRGGYVILGTMPNGLPEIDVYDWKGIHDAFVTKPAFGDDAEITATCEGEGCRMRLLTAAEIKAAGELNPLKVVPIMVRHRGKLTFVSVPEAVATEIGHLDKVGEPEILPILRASLISFSSCACNSGQRMTDKDHKDEELSASAKKALAEKDEKIKELESKLAKAQKAAEVATVTPAAQTAAAEGGAGQQTASAGEGGAKAAKAQDSEQIKSLKATIDALQTEAKKPFIAKMVEARKVKGADDEAIKQFEKSLVAKSLEDVKAQFASEEILINDALTARGEDPKVHFGFNGGQEGEHALTGKSLEEILGESAD